MARSLDEELETCGSCPIQGRRMSYSHRTWEELKHAGRTGTGLNWTTHAQATLFCKHNATKRPICAIPCDGIPQLCEDDIDEQCEGLGLEIVLGMTLIAALMFIGFMFGLERFFNLNSPELSVEDEEISTSMPDILEKLVVHKTMWEVEESVNAAIEHYNVNIHTHSKRRVRDHLFLESMGTNELTAFFYDCANQAVMIQIYSCLTKRMSWLFKIMKKEVNLKLVVITGHVTFLVVRYSDFAKDMFLLYIIWVRLGNYEFSSFPMIIFCILALSILSCELANFIIFLVNQDFKRLKATTKILLAFVFPLIPAIFLFKCLKQKLSQLDEIELMKKEMGLKRNSSSHEISKKLEKELKTMRDLNFVSANMQCIENVLENIPQLTIVVLITLLSHTSTRTVENIDGLFVKGNQHLGYMFILLTILSLIRGQLSYFKAYKNGCQMGIMVLFPYFSIGVVSRQVSKEYIRLQEGILDLRYLF